MTTIIRADANTSKSLSPCVAAIGNFDGVHLGHQCILRQVIALAKTRTIKSRLISFNPLPHEFFSDQPPARLYNLRQKLEALRVLGLDELVILRFDQRLADMPPAPFTSDLLQKRLNTQALWVGEDFRFGAKRSGGLEDLRAAFADQLHVEPDFVYGQERISSTRLRRALSQGDLELAEALFGRPYQITGHVIHGDKLGRRIGFPTLNIAHKLAHLPLRGVFAAEVTIGAQRFDAAVNIGVRPTVQGTQARVEAHLIEAKGNFYGKLATVTLRKRVRDEQKFADVGALAQQLLVDVTRCKSLLSKS